MWVRCACVVSKHSISEESTTPESSTSLPVIVHVNAQRQLSDPIVVTVSVIALVLVPVILSILVAICVRQRRRSKSSMLHLCIS